jgi:hypothetical protein
VWLPATLKLPLPPVIVPGEAVPSPQLIDAEYAFAVALVLGSVKVATVPPMALPGLPVNEKPPVGTVSTIVVSNDTVASVCPTSRLSIGYWIPIALS